MKRLRFAIGILVVAVVLFFAGRMRFFDPVQGLISAATRPIQQPLSTAAIRLSRFFTRADVQEVMARNDELQSQVADLVIENAKLRSTIEQDETLREQFRFLQEQGYEGIPGRVIGRGTDESIALIILSVGSNHGVVQGLPAITRDGVLIGKVIEVNDATSKVLLVLDSQSNIPSAVQNATKSPGTVVGHLGLSMSMEYIPQDEVLELGQTILTSGIEETLPANLIIGTVGEISKQPGAFFQSATVAPILSYDTIEFVTLLLPKT